MKTIHGCRCKKNYKVGKWAFDNGVCVYGGNDGAGGKKGTCPPVRDRKNLSKECIKDAYRPRCIVEEQGKCGYRGVNWGGVLDKDENWDYCEDSAHAQLYGTNAGVGSPKYKNPRKHIIGLVIFICLFAVFFPFIIYYISKNILFSFVWTANLPLFATAIGFHNGLFGSRYFSFLYREIQETLFEKISHFILFFISLFSLLFIVLNTSFNNYKKNKLNLVKIGIIVLVYFVTINMHINIPKIMNTGGETYGQILPNISINVSQIRHFLRYIYITNTKSHPHSPRSNTRKSIIITLLIIIMLIAIESAFLLKM
jgi:hypothetical protein